jgi:hypothetical protein
MAIVRIKPKFVGTRNFIGFMMHNLQLGHVHGVGSIAEEHSICCVNTG